VSEKIGMEATGEIPARGEIWVAGCMVVFEGEHGRNGIGGIGG